MEAALRLVDESIKGEVLREFTLKLASERVSVREIIEQRVRHEVDAFNQEQSASIFHGLVQPTDTERHLNGYRFRKPRRIDAEEQIANACRAFEANGFFMLADNRQIESLDDEIGVTPETRISFLKLVPLVGG